MMLLGRISTLIATRWYVRMHVGTQESLHMSGPLECAIPYVLLMRSIEYYWCSRVTDELWTVRDEFSYQSSGSVLL